MGELVSHTSWMRNIPDDTPVTVLSIPGTHDSGCIGGPLGVAQTQNVDLCHQLDAGIRFLDIRLAQYQDDLVIHHDVVCMGKNYTEVLDICSDFLKEHPSETILMSIKDEDRVDSGLGRFAPSEILGKLSMGDVPDGDQNTASFEDDVKKRTWEHLGKAPLFYNFAAGPTDGDSRTAGRTLTSDTTLGEVRGKIVLLRRFQGSDDVGLDLTYWPDNQAFRSAAPPVHVVHDRYQGLAEEEKYELILTHLEEARRGDPEDLYITFSSAVDVKAHGYAETINPRLNDYLAESPGGRVGIIVMDFFDKPLELTSNVIEMNMR